MTHRERSGTGDITKGVIWKQLLSFFFPILLSGLLQQFYNATDAVIVGNFVGKQALSAVGGPTGVIAGLIVNCFIGLSSGATVIISQYFGAGLKDEVNRCVHTAVGLALVLGVVFMISGILLTPAILRAMGTPEDVLPGAVTYLRIYFAGMIPNTLYNMGAGILRSMGDSKRPLYFLAASCSVNIALDVLFVAVFHWEVAGAAVATVIAQVISAALTLFVLTRSRDCSRLMLKKIRIEAPLLRRIFRIGVPAAFQSAMYSVSNIIVQVRVNAFGTNTVAAWSAYSKLDGLYWAMIAAFGISITTFVGQNYGACKPERVRRGVRVCFAIAMAASAAVSVLFCALGNNVFYLFVSDPDVVSIGKEILYFLAPTFCTYVCIEIFSGAMRGMGDSFVPAAMTCVGICGLRIVWLFTAALRVPTLQTVAASYPISWSITSLCFLACYCTRGKRILRGCGPQAGEGKQPPEPERRPPE